MSARSPGQSRSANLERAAGVQSGDLVGVVDGPDVEVTATALIRLTSWRVTSVMGHQRLALAAAQCALGLRGQAGAPPGDGGVGGVLEHAVVAEVAPYARHRVAATDVGIELADEALLERPQGTACVHLNLLDALVSHFDMTIQGGSRGNHLRWSGGTGRSWRDGHEPELRLRPLAA